MFSTTAFGATLLMLIGQIASENIGFSAVFDKSQVIPQNQIIKYDKVITNNGNAYNKQDGVFTAPSRGAYLFSINALSKQSELFVIDLYHNDKYIVSAYGTGKSAGFGAASNTIFLNLEENDRVYVKTQRQVHLFGSPKEVYASFTGFLVTQETFLQSVKSEVGKFFKKA